MPFHKQIIRIIATSLFLLLSSIQPNATTNSAILPVTFTTSGYNNPIEIRGIEILDPSGPQTGTLTLNPHSTYRLSVGLTDWDGFDAVFLKVSLLNISSFDIGSFRTDPIAPEGAFRPTDLEGNVFTFTYTRLNQEDSLAITYATGVDETTSTWELISSELIPDPDLPSEATLTIDFKVSHVATANSNWIAFVEAKNTQDETTGFLECSEPFKVAWYGEIGFKDTRSVNFEVLYNADPDANAQSVSLNAISNGGYILTALVGETWQGVTPVKNPSDNYKNFVGNYSDLPKDSPDPFADQNFAFKIHPSDDASHPIRLLKSAENEILTLTNKTRETGTTTDFMLSLHLASIFQNGAYTGTLTFGIENPITFGK